VLAFFARNWTLPGRDCRDSDSFVSIACWSSQISKTCRALIGLPVNAAGLVDALRETLTTAARGAFPGVPSGRLETLACLRPALRACFVARKAINMQVLQRRAPGQRRRAGFALRKFALRLRGNAG
jgi:hypothetical protein